MATLGGIIADGPIAGDVAQGSIATTQAEAFAVADVAATLVIPGGGVAENLTLGDTYGLHVVYQSSVIEGFRLASFYLNVSTAAIIQAFSLSVTILPQVNIVLIEAFRTFEAIGTTEKTSLTIAESIRLAETLFAFAGLYVSDSFRVVNSVPVYLFTAGVALGEHFLFRDQLQDKLVLRLQAADDVDLEDDPLANFIYSTTVAEQIVTDLLYQSPDGGVTSFAINTRTNSITEYKNFVFNSFASMGRKFIAADENGLYELNGARDLTTDVIAQIAGGYFQFNGSKFSGLKGVYIGVRGQGNYLLKIRGGDGTERIYQTLSNPGRMSTKVNIGKGIRTRYLAWELINNDGQDFSLDTVEFVPMTSARRI